jgi:hypothetical protein
MTDFDAKLRHFAAVVRARPLRRYDLIGAIPVEVSHGCAANARAEGRYECLGITVELGLPFPVDESTLGRTRRMWITAWDHLEPLFVALDEQPDPAVLQSLLGLVLEAIGKESERHPVQPYDAETSPREQDFYLYDQAVAGRLYRLAYLLDAYCRDPAADFDIVKRLMAALRWHVGALSFPENISERHNHGLHQTISQICATSRFFDIGSADRALEAYHGLDASYWEARARLPKLLAQQFTAEGVHKEHSVFYHLWLARALGFIVDMGIETDPAVAKVAKAAADAAAWMVDGRQRAANLGDTDLEPPLYRSQLPPASREGGVAARHFPEAGYWFVKGSGAHGPTYLAETAALHSRFHKQADTGSVLWQDRGLDILIDAGRYAYSGRTEVASSLFQDGFWYADPKRIYVESTRAHSTLEMDGQNHRRFRQPAFGGSITHATEADGVFASRSQIRHLGRASHVRYVLLEPGEWLLVVDTARAADGAAHAFRQWFQVHPDWGLSHLSDDGFSFAGGGEELAIVPVFAGQRVATLARGETHPPDGPLDPGYLGWWSPAEEAFEPCTSIAMETRGEHVTMASLLAFGRPAVDQSFSGFNASRRRIRLRWTKEGLARTVVIADEVGQEGGAFTVSVK